MFIVIQYDTSKTLENPGNPLEEKNCFCRFTSGKSMNKKIHTQGNPGKSNLGY